MEKELTDIIESPASDEAKIRVIETLIELEKSKSNMEGYREACRDSLKEIK